MTRTPDKDEVTKFLESSKLGKLKYERSPTITSYRQVLPCVRVKPLSKGDTPDSRNNSSFGLGKINGGSRVSLNNSIQSDKSSIQLDSSSLDISSINGDSFTNETPKKAPRSKSKKEVEKLTEDSLKRLYDFETKKMAYMNALKTFEDTVEKTSSEKIDTSLDEPAPRKDSWENKREQKIEDLIKTFKNITIPLPESKIEIPKPIPVVPVNVPKSVPSLSKSVLPTIIQEPVSQPAPQISFQNQPTPPITASLQTEKKAPEVVKPLAEIQKPTVTNIGQGVSVSNTDNSTTNVNSSLNTTVISQSLPADNQNTFETPKGIQVQTVQPTNLFGSDVAKQNNVTVPTKPAEAVPTIAGGSVEFSFASVFAANEYEDTSVPTPPVINIKSLSLQDYANVPSEAIYDYYIYQRYVLFNKAKQFEETNSEKAKSIKRCFSEFNKLTETNKKDVLTYLLKVYTTRQCMDGNKNIQLMDEDNSFDFAVFRGCFVALNILVSQKFTLILYNLAAVVCVLCSRIPLYRDCFLGFLYKQCPYAIPYIPSRKPNESRENYSKRCGNLRNMSSEDFQLFIQKNMKFYGAILQMNLPEERHSLNMFYAWNYLQRFLTSIEQFQQNKLSISSCILIEGFLSTCSHRLFELYNRRFSEIFLLIKNFYLPNILKIEDQTNDLNQQAYHLLHNFINRVEKVITKQNRSQELRDFDIPDRFFLEFFSN